MNITTPINTGDYELFKGIINQGIDSHLEGFTESTFEEKYVNGQPRLVMDFKGKDIDILIRRLEECETEDAEMWADDIRESLFNINLILTKKKKDKER